MNRTIAAFWGMGLVTIFALATLGATQEPTPLTPQELQNAIDVQPRGPIHEAYAQPFNSNAQPSAPTPKAPPAAIPEEPPEQRPEADNAQWIPGYWAWDAERQEYLWVSGVYRVPPQGRTFVPGYWTETPEGWRWVAGFWAPTQQEELPYTPEPPAPLDSNGPSLPAPDEDSTYIQGTWVYRDTRFVWRPGYYAPYRAGRLWCPSHYSWTPQGYLFIDGYWDYPLEDRGLLFAPVYFRQPLWRNPGWAYRPDFVVGIGAFFDTGFVRAGSLHFYFGNYYGGNYSRLGYSPWYSGTGRYDPAFAYYGVQNRRTNPNFVASAQRTFAGRSAGTLAAPPVTLAQQNALVAANAKTPRVVAPLAQAATVNSTRLVQASPTQVTAQRTFAQQTRKIATTRSQLDAAANTGTGGAGTRANAARSLSLPTVLQGAGTSPGGTPTKNRPTAATNPTPTGPTIINGTSINPTPSKGIAQPRADIQPTTPKTVAPQPLVNTAPIVVTPQVQPRVNVQPPTPKSVSPQPLVTAPPTVVTPQVQPRVNVQPPTPKTVAPQPQIINIPASAPPKAVTPQPQPRANIPPPPTPSQAVAPQPQPRVINTPPPAPTKTFAPQPQPRINIQPPAPPKAIAPQPQPRYNPPPPRANPPSPPPRASVPVSQPRVQPAPPPRPNNPPPAAKPSSPPNAKRR